VPINRRFRVYGCSLKLIERVTGKPEIDQKFDGLANVPIGIIFGLPTRPSGIRTFTFKIFIN
jgi:hypothetical protein